MSLEGRLTIALHPRRGRAEIRSSRPLRAVRIFEGRRPREVLMQVPLLFSVCGMAQATAAVQAFRQSVRGEDATGGAADTARRLLTRLETAREHLWRILMDWPALLGEPPDPRRAAPLQPLLRDLRRALFGDADAFALEAEARPDGQALPGLIRRLEEILQRLVFGCPPGQWLRIGDGGALVAWAGDTQTVAARLLREMVKRGWQDMGDVPGEFLPELRPAALNRRLQARDAERFIAAPQWHDGPCETTPLARQCGSPLIRSLRGEHGDGLLTRQAARLVELARIPPAMRRLADGLTEAAPREVAGDALPPGVGIGQVEAARGRLVHRVEVADGVVRRYQILAPTEWNFHPRGTLARALGTLRAGDEATLRRQAALLIDAVDPCVGYRLRVH